MDIKECMEIASGPIFFERNRVFRVYTGGKLFHDFFGDEDIDGNLPEEWIASCVKAIKNVSHNRHEGVSKIRGKQINFDQLLACCKEMMIGEKHFDILVKVLDSAIRLPAQVHPDKPFSRQYFGSNFGKTEAWLILATRENAKIFYGFKDGVTKNDLIAAIKNSETDKTAMESLMNELPANKGDVYLIPAKMIHAIGYGCLILEVQEPTDFTIQPEAWCGDYHLSDYEMYLGLDKDIALDCFDFSVSGQEAVKIGKKRPVVLDSSEGFTSESLISYQDTSCFAVNRHYIRKGDFALANAPSVYVVTEGKGILKKEAYQQPLKKGDYFFMPYAAKNKYRVRTEEGLELVECLPSLNY